ncbi:MAG: 16S rRNA processing protein RimM [Fimbriimonadaceae bacterium]|nr:16S rRNA processing protein RimM [Fimbriimonadaceae bacterium]
MTHESELRIGRIVGAHGTRGAVRVETMTDFPSRFAAGKSVLLRGAPVTIVSASFHAGQARLVLEGVDTREAADALKWEYVCVPAGERPETGEGEYLERELVGCTVVDPQGRPLGEFERVFHTPAHDLWQVSGVLVPAIREFVESVSLADRLIVVRPIPGMFPEESPP